MVPGVQCCVRINGCRGTPHSQFQFFVDVENARLEIVHLCQDESVIFIELGLF